MDGLKTILLYVPEDADLMSKTVEIDGKTLGVLTAASIVKGRTVYVSGVLNHLLEVKEEKKVEEIENVTFDDILRG